MPAQPVTQLSPSPPDEPVHSRGMEAWSLLFWGLFAACIAMALMPVQLTDLLPLRDLPLHMHMARAWSEWHVSPLLQAHYLRPDVLVPGELWYRLASALAGIGGMEWATRLLLCLSLGLLPLSALHLLRALGHSRWLVFGVLPWLFAGDFFVGALPWMMALPLLLWLLAAHITLHRRPGLWRAVLVSLLFAVVTLAHPLAGLVAAVVLPAVGALAGAHNGWRRALLWPLREAILCLPTVILTLPWLSETLIRIRLGGDERPVAAVFSGARLLSSTDATHLTPLGAAAQLFNSMFNQFSGTSGEVGGLPELFLQRPGELVSGLWLLGFGLWLVASLKGEATIRPEPPHRPEAGKRPPWINGSAWIRWTLLCTVVVYLFLPQHVTAPVILSEVSARLVGLLAILAVLALPLRPLQPGFWRGRLGALCVLLAAVIMPLQTTGAFMMARTEFGGIRAAYGAIAAQRKVLTLRSRRGSPWLRQPINDHLGSYYAVLQGGIAPESFGAIWPRLLLPVDPPLPVPEQDPHSRFSLNDHGRFYDYVVLHRGIGESPGEWEQTLGAWNALYVNDRWQVLRNPAPAEWPEPDAAELARRREAARRAVLPGLDALPAFDALPAAPSNPITIDRNVNVRPAGNAPMLRPLFGPEMQLPGTPHVPESTAPTAPR